MENVDTIYRNGYIAVSLFLSIEEKDEVKNVDAIYYLNILKDRLKNHIVIYFDRADIDSFISIMMARYKEVTEDKNTKEIIEFAAKSFVDIYRHLHDKLIDEGIDKLPSQISSSILILLVAMERFIEAKRQNTQLRENIDKISMN